MGVTWALFLVPISSLATNWRWASADIGTAVLCLGLIKWKREWLFPGLVWFFFSFFFCNRSEFIRTTLDDRVHLLVKSEVRIKNNTKISCCICIRGYPRILLYQVLSRQLFSQPDFPNNNPCFIAQLRQVPEGRKRRWLSELEMKWNSGKLIQLTKPHYESVRHLLDSMESSCLYRWSSSSKPVWRQASSPHTRTHTRHCMLLTLLTADKVLNGQQHFSTTVLESEPAHGRRAGWGNRAQLAANKDCSSSSP